jgi:hypothetical protein
MHKSASGVEGSAKLRIEGERKWIDEYLTTDA